MGFGSNRLKLLRINYDLGYSPTTPLASPLNAGRANICCRPGHRVSAQDHRLAAVLNAGQRRSPPRNATCRQPSPKLYLFLGGLRVTNPTIRLVCPSVCLSVRPSVCPSVCLSVRLSVNISLVNTITQQILGALIRNLYHGCISGVSWLSSKMDDLDLFLRSRGSI